MRRRCSARTVSLARGRRLDPRQYLAADPIQRVLVRQNLRGDALALAEQAEQDVLGTDVVVLELQCLAQDSSSTFFARGVNGMCPPGGALPRPIMASTEACTSSCV